MGGDMDNLKFVGIEHHGVIGAVVRWASSSVWPG
jgi:hypothetical protein